MFDAPHGAVCAALLPHVCATNLRACREGSSGVSDSDAAHKATRTLDCFAHVARLVTGDPGASPEQGVEWLAALVTDLGIPGLKVHGIVEEDAPAIAAQALRSSSMKGNPVALSLDDLTLIVQAAL
jgi:alcohol dehydrogenase class IV